MVPNTIVLIDVFPDVEEVKSGLQCQLVWFGKDIHRRMCVRV